MALLFAYINMQPEKKTVAGQGNAPVATSRSEISPPECEHCSPIIINGRVAHEGECPNCTVPWNGDNTPEIKINRFSLLFHRWPKSFAVWTGDDEAILYSHVNAFEYALEGQGNGELEIVEDGESRWITYRDGERID